MNRLAYSGYLLIAIFAACPGIASAKPFEPKGSVLFFHKDRLYLQFRKGRLAGWKGD
ncbi:MAG: hypothetical protein JWP25_2394 [Bradyrhizobium sp.]|jgi:hypothetical protein|nr:hypothetical protein [Bradyrhizobium sp.]MEA2866471.1 hypothetical protein [Bradyrhizobium sp.]